MRIYLGSDHRGFELKEEIKQWLVDNDFEVEDVGSFVFDPDDDYVDPAIKVAESIEGNGGTSRGILLCGSGHGVDIVANRFPHVRAIIGFNDEVTVQAREHEDANILVLPAEWMTADEACERVRMFLSTAKADNARHERRRSRIDNLNIR
ncbi:RpiB/LacA/LacB family sugar-phosphate isomerase [Candidatus Woesebacteria bacterium]|nr:RpiB/LacA/LacB family sugar-phosphate isomerase [Candidatus Woesebacteria bacterium]